MTFDLFFVLHDQKTKIDRNIIQNSALLANPPLSESDMLQIEELALQITDLNKLHQFSLAISAPLARCVQTASIICVALGIEFFTDSRLGQFASGGDNEEPVFYPGHERDWHAT